MIIIIVNYLAVFSNKPIVELDFNTGAESTYAIPQSNKAITPVPTIIFYRSSSSTL